VNDYQLSLGDQLRLRLQDPSHAYRTITFHYVGIVNEFPTAPRDSFLVANAAYVGSVTGDPHVSTLLVDTGGSHIDAVAAQVRSRIGSAGNVTTLTDARGLVGSSLTSVDLAGLTRLELGFALVIVASAAGLVVGLGLDNRRKGAAVAAALGATPRQLRSLTVGEPVFVAVVGLGVGAVTGTALSYLLVQVLSGVFDPPPAHPSAPWGYLTAAALSAIVAVGATTTWVARRTRLRAGEFLREL
jgi:putative ABC transport system permease protein